jgi:hypothetical protein
MRNYYYYLSAGKKHGPFSLEQLEQETIFESTLVWSNHSDEWKKASEYKELKAFLYANPEIPENLKSPDVALFAKVIYRRYVLFSFSVSIIFSFIVLFKRIQNESKIIEVYHVDFWFRVYKDILNLLTDSAIKVSYFECQTPIINLPAKMLLSTFASNIPLFAAYGLILYIYESKFNKQLK